MNKIMIVEDEDNISRLLEVILKEAGYEVIIAEDGEQALKMFVSSRPDLILLDIYMPNMDGEETLTEIKKTAQKIPIVMCSGSADVECAIRCIRLGALDYITKPFDHTDVLNAVKKALSGKGIASAGKKETKVSVVSEGIIAFNKTAEEQPEKGQTVTVSENATAFDNSEIKQKKYEECRTKKLGIYNRRVCQDHFY